MVRGEPVQKLDSAPQRFTSLPLPPYRHIPGQTPHPISDPAGHAFGQPEALPQPLTAANWRGHETWLYAADLFNHGYYWEAHEAWESLWHAAGRVRRDADLFKGLIKLAAAGVKHYENRPAGVRRHAARAAELLAPLAGEFRFGLAVAAVQESAEQFARDGIPDGERLPLVLALDFTEV
jgi:hypothetical protein